MYTNAEPKKEIKDSHSMLLPKLVSELMAMRKQLPAPREKSITFVGITVIHQFHEKRVRHEFTYSTFTVYGTWRRRNSQSCMNRPAPGYMPQKVKLARCSHCSPPATDGQLFHLGWRVSFWKPASIFSTRKPERPSCSNRSVSSYFGKGQQSLTDLLQLIFCDGSHHSQLGPLWQRLVSVSVRLCRLSHDVNVTRCCKLTSNMTGPTRRQFQRDRYNTILIRRRIRLHSKRPPLPTGKNS